MEEITDLDTTSKKLTSMQRPLFESKLLKKLFITSITGISLVFFVRENPTSMRSIPMFIVPHWLERSTNTISLPMRPSAFALSSSLNPETKIWDALCDLVLFAQFKKCEKHPWSSVTLVKLQASASNFTKRNTLLWVCFHVFKILLKVPNRAKHQIYRK